MATNEIPAKRLRHQPAMAPRPCVRGECVFAKRWAKQMTRPARNTYCSTPLEAVLKNSLGVIGQREATVAASVICWLGTNCGRFFLSDARRLANSSNLSEEDAFVATWAMRNRRQVATNSGLRALELVLITDEDQRLNRVCTRSSTDYETAEQVVAWLGQEAGRAFLARCETEIERCAMLEQPALVSRTWRGQLATARRLEGPLVNGTQDREQRA